MKGIIMIGALLCVFNATAQRIYKIGDKLPDLTISELINYHTPAVNLNSITAEIIILEFWSTRCPACIASMDKMAAIQNRYNGKVLVYLLTVDSVNRVESFFRKRPQLKKLGLPVSCDGSSWQKLLPHKAVPHLVWLNKEKRITAITGSEHCTQENIDLMLQGRQLNLPLKWELMDYTTETPLFNTLSAPAKQIQFSALLTQPVEGIPPGMAMVQNGQYKKVIAKNLNLRSMLAFAYRRQIFIPLNEYSQRIIAANDSLLNLQYCFELQVSANYSEEELLSRMRSNLEQILSFKSKVTAQKRNCIIIKPSQTAKKEKSGTCNFNETEQFVELTNCSVKRAVGFINSYNTGSKLILYEGDDNYTITIAISKTSGKPETLFPILKAQGYTITEELRELNIIEVIN